MRINCRNGHARSWRATRPLWAKMEVYMAERSIARTGRVVAALIAGVLVITLLLAGCGSSKKGYYAPIPMAAAHTAVTAATR
jgi:hypothetical protein